MGGFLAGKLEPMAENRVKMSFFLLTVAKINLVFFAIGFISSQTKTETSTNAYSQTT